jgi:hypothetical protein
MRKWGSVAVCLALVIGVIMVPSEASGASSGKVVVIVMENETYGDVFANSQAPYLNQLASQGQLFTNYTAVAPASNPNYLAMTSGLTSALAPPSPNIFQAFDAAGTGTWKSFMESMPGNCASGNSAAVPGTTVGLYTADHDPAYAYRANTTCTANDVPMTTSTFNPASLPDFSYVVPNECNDMHTLPANGQACPSYFGPNPGTSLINMSDNWLAKVVPSLLAQPDVTVLITWDEGRQSTTPPQHIMTLEVGAGVPAGSDATAYNHYGLEAGLYRFFGLGTPPNNGATATPLPILSGSPTPTAPPAPARFTAVPSNSSVALTWTAGDPTASYRLSRSTDPNFSTSTSVTLPAGSSSYSDSSLAAGVYYYRLVAVTSAGQSGFVPAAAATTSYAGLVAGRAGTLARWRLGESSGTTAADVDGRFDGTYENGPALASVGAIARDPNTSVTFNGSTQRVTMPALGSAGDFSIEGWTYLTNSSVNNNAMFAGSGTVRLLARPGSGATAAYAGVTLGGTEYMLQPASAGSNLNTWVNWVLTRQGAMLTLYRNGVALAHRSDLPATATASLNGYIADQNGPYYLNGRVDEVAVYNRALSSTDVSNGYVAGVNGVAPGSSTTPSTYNSLVTADPTLLAYWRLGESSGTTAADAGGRFDGAYVNGPALGSPGAIARDANTSVAFNGSNQRVTVPAMPSAGDFSIEGWTCLTNPSVNNNTVFGGSGTVRLLARPGTGSTAAYAGVTLGGTEYVLQPNSVGSNLNTWVYWVLTRKGATLTLYRDGVELGHRSDLPASAAASLNGYIADQNNGNYYLTGKLDEVAVYTSALSPAVVANHYQAAT